MRIVSLGLGPTAGPMAGHLLAASHALLAWNRATASAAPLAEAGAAVAAAEAEAAADAELVILMLENGPVVKRAPLGDGLDAAITLGAVVADMHSIGGRPRRDLGDRAIHVACHRAMIDCTALPPAAGIAGLARFHLAAHGRLQTDVPRGALIREDAVEIDGSVLHSLRRDTALPAA